MNWSWSRFLLTLIVGLILALLYHFFLRSKGKRYEEIYDRVVEESTDESTRIKSLVDGHDVALKDRDATLARLHAEHGDELAKLKNEHDSAKSAHADLTERFAALQRDHDGVTAAHARCGAEIQSLTARLAEATAGPDDLKLVEGIGPKMEQALNASGITRWVHVRDASEDALRAAVEKAGMTLAPSIPTWSKQAAYLAAGDQAGFKKYTDYLVAGVDPAAMAGSQELHGAEALAAATPSSSESTEPKNPDGSDNLLIIEGIGPKFNEALLHAGIRTFAGLASASEDALRSALSSAGLSFAPSVPTWSKQAAFLVRGDRAGFDEYTKFLVAGRDPSA